MPEVQGGEMSIFSKDKKLQLSIELVMLINGINKHQAKNMILDAFEKWAKRSQHIWKIDLSWLKEKCPVCENKEGE